MRTLNLYNYTAKKRDMMINGKAEVLTGVYHDPEGVAVAAGLHFLVATKQLYNPDQSGKAVNKGGEVVNVTRNYPKWRYLIPTQHKNWGNEDTGVTVAQLCKFVREVKKALKGQGKKPSEINNTAVEICTPTGMWRYFCNNLTDFAACASFLGGGRVMISYSGVLNLSNDNGNVITMPVITDLRAEFTLTANYGVTAC